MTLDVLIEQTNPDFQDLLILFRDRVRWLYGFIVQGIVDNPGVSVSSARSAVVSAYASQFPVDNFLSLNPGNCFDALVTRHGTGSTAGERFTSFKTKVLTMTDNGGLKDRYLESLEEGMLPPLAELWHERLIGDSTKGIPQAQDLAYLELRDSTPGPTFNFVKERRWSSASLGKTVRRVITNAFDGVRVNRVEGPTEVV